MAVQNAYNNYMGRQQKKPINNFKEKVKNSLGGVPTQGTMKAPNHTPTTPPISHSKPIQPYNVGNTPKPNNTPITTPPVAPQTPTTPQAPITPQAPQGENTQGLISTSEVNQAFKPTQVNDVPVEVTAPITPQQVMEVANDPQVRAQAYAEKKSPQQMAQELLESQKKQLQKDWEQKQAEIKLQQEQAQAGFDQSKVDTDKAYQESIDTINQDRYNRQQDLNVSGANRGIQYSPQQLGLETVANINTNKNVTEAGKQRNELLSKLQEQINQLNANILMSSQASINDYNKALSQLNSDYANKIMDWEWNQQQTDDERKWQQSQTEADRAWQEKMDKADKEWQEKMADKNKKSGNSYSYSGGSYGNSYSRGGRSWSDYNGYSMDGYGDAFQSDLASGDEIARQVYDTEFKNNSTDLYNSLDAGGTYDVYDRARIYNEETQGRYDYGAVDPVTKERMDNTKNTALKHLQTKSYARDTNTPYQIGETVYQPKTPVRDSYKDKIKASKFSEQKRYDDTFGIKRPANEKFNQGINARAEKLISGMNKPKPKPKPKPKTTVKRPSTASSHAKDRLESSVKKKSTPKPKPKSKVSKSVSKSKSNVKKSTSKSKANVKKTTKKSSKTQKKSVSKSKKNTKSSFRKSYDNLKKNVKKLFGR